MELGNVAGGGGGGGAAAIGYMPYMYRSPSRSNG